MVVVVVGGGRRGDGTTSGAYVVYLAVFVVVVVLSKIGWPCGLWSQDRLQTKLESGGIPQGKKKRS